MLHRQDHGYGEARTAPERGITGIRVLESGSEIDWGQHKKTIRGKTVGGKKMGGKKIGGIKVLNARITPSCHQLHTASPPATTSAVTSGGGSNATPETAYRAQFARMESENVLASVEKDGQSCASNHQARAEHVDAELNPQASCHGRTQRTRGGYSAYEALRCVGVKPFPDSRGPHEHDPTPNSSGNAQAQLYATVSEGR